MSGLVRVSIVLAAFFTFCQAVQAASFREALSHAYSQNMNLRSPHLAAQMADENISLSQSARMPTIEGSVENAHSWTWTGGNWTDDNALTAGITYNQTLFDNFRSDAEIAQARATAEESRYAALEVEQQVLLAAANAYVTVLRDTRLVQLKQENIGFFRSEVASARERLRVGTGTSIEVSQAESRLAQSIADHSAAVASLQTSRASYHRWVGREPQNLSDPEDLSALFPKTIDHASRLAETAHPAIQRALATSAASKAASDAARSAFGPSLTLAGSLCVVDCFGSAAGEGMSGSVRLKLSVPIFDGGATSATARRANLQEIKSEVDAVVARDQVRELLISSWSAAENANAQLTSAAAAVAASRKALGGVIEEREVGLKTTLDVLNARAEVALSREAVILAKSGKVSAALALLAATGQFNAERLGLI